MRADSGNEYVVSYLYEPRIMNWNDGVRYKFEEFREFYKK